LTAALEAADARVDEVAGVRASLDPSRRRATSLTSLYQALAPELDDARREVLAEGLVRVADAVIEHFPENLLWDYDAPVAAVVRRCADADALCAALARVVELHALFGRHTAIRFRYVHDLIYGFDWAKWVRRDAAARASIGPYDAAFFDAIHARGHELLELIAADDAKYPRLRDRRARNPFPFSREPEAELRLHRRLAAEGLVPVEAWRRDPSPVWDRPFADLREARAARL